MRAAGGLITAISKKHIGDSAATATEIRDGRVVCVSFTIGGVKVAVVNVHIDMELHMASRKATISDIGLWARRNNDTTIFVVGELNFCAIDEGIFSVSIGESVNRHTGLAEACDSALNMTELECPAFTHRSEPYGRPASFSRIDRCYINLSLPD